MATNFPNSLDDSTTIPVESANTKLSTNHVTAHQNIQDAIEAIETKVGANSSAVTTSHDYKLSTITGSNKAVSNNGGTLTSPIINLGSDAEGDTYYRNSSGALTRLARGTDNYIYKMNGNVPNWEAETALSNASTTVAGITELATSAEISAGTATGGTGAALVVTPDALAASTPVFNGSGLTNLTNPAVYKSGNTTYDLTAASGTQTIAHGLGKTPKYVRITYKKQYSNQPAGSSTPVFFDGVGTYNGSVYANTYNGSDSSSTSIGYLSTFQSTSDIVVYTAGSGGTNVSQTATVSSLDSTNITLSWTKLNSPTGTLLMTWEAFA